MIRAVLANVAVTDLHSAEQWYTRLFEREHDARPMSGLIEWHLSETSGGQVWSQPDRAGHSAVVLDETDLDAAVTRLSAAETGHDGPQPGGGARILQLADPDGNQVVLTGT